MPWRCWSYLTLFGPHSVFFAELEGLGRSAFGCSRRGRSNTSWQLQRIQMITIEDGKNDDNILYYICIYLGGYRGILLLAKAEGVLGNLARSCIRRLCCFSLTPNCALKNHSDIRRYCLCLRSRLSWLELELHLFIAFDFPSHHRKASYSLPRSRRCFNVMESNQTQNEYFMSQQFA